MVYLAQGSAVEVHAIKPLLTIFINPEFAGLGELFGSRTMSSKAFR